MSLRQDCVTRTSPRVASIDFWRGLVLCTIFIDHIPGNIFENVTQKNFGYSDSAEAFVFLSGASLALAYGPRFSGGRAAEVIGVLARRAAKLYGVHIAISLAAIGIFTLGAMAISSSALLEVHGRDLFVDDPPAALIGLVSLGHQLGYFNILPLYILLLAMVPPLLWIGGRRPVVMVAVSFAAYLASRYWGWNMPTWPMKGTWFFDPFSWQFIMTLGIWAGLVSRNARLAITVPRVVLALGVTALGLFSVTDGLSLAPGLDDWMRGWADVDKGVLGFGRVVHFLGFAYLVYAFRISDRLRGGVVSKHLCRLGRNSLWTFALLSLLAAVGQVVSEGIGHPILLDGVMICGGLAALSGAAALLEMRPLPLLPGVARRG